MEARTLTVRAAEPEDAGAIARIHNQGIEERVATFLTREQTREDALARLERSSPMLVAESDGEILGWTGAGPYDPAAEYYKGVGEVTVFVDRSARRLGVGRQLLDALASRATDHGRYKLLAKIFTTNHASLELFKRCGYRQVGTHERLDGGWRDVVVVERALGPE